MAKGTFLVCQAAKLWKILILLKGAEIFQDLQHLIQRGGGDENEILRITEKARRLLVYRFASAKAIHNETKLVMMTGLSEDLMHQQADQEDSLMVDLEAATVTEVEVAFHITTEGVFTGVRRESTGGGGEVISQPLRTRSYFQSQPTKLQE
ncbi:hypothetical protein BD560DRAFT_493555 [Blakeslea trispora]|nr:hypothetical protein BD560DRAFT_493555 [Blakeslea trispora]